MAHETDAAVRQRVEDLIDGFWAVQVMNAAATLKLPDALAGGTATADALAAEVGGHLPNVARLLRALEGFGLVRSAGGGRYELTGAGQLLREGVPGSVRGRVMFTGGMLWSQFGDLTHVVRTGGTAPSVTAGREGFDALKQDPAALDAFQQAMAESSVPAAREALAAYPFERHRRVLDLGGGYGGVLSTLLSAHPHLTGDICDLGYLADGARAYLERAGVADRAGFIPGDFFAEVPTGYDLYLLKFIIHDWDDDHAARILTNVAKAAAPDARIVLLEQVMPDAIDGSRDHRAVIRSDLTMMTVGGKERTAEEYRSLLADAGLQLKAIRPSGPRFSVIEADPSA